MKFLKLLLPTLLVFSLLLCSCSVDSLGDIISSITGNTKEPEHVIPEYGFPDGSELEEKPNEDPEENPGDTPDDDPTDENPGDENPGEDNKDDNKDDNNDKEDTDVILERRSLAGKTIVNFGDSIFGLNSGTGTEVSAVLANITGATVYNSGYGGCRMASYLKADGSINEPWDAFSMYRLVDAIVSGDFSYQEAAFGFNEPNMRAYFKTHLNTLQSLDFNKVDIVTISFGTNDFTSSKNNPKAVGENKYNTHALEGALRYSIEKLHKAYPHLEIYVSTPIYRTWFNSDKTAITGDSTTYKNKFGYTLSQYCEMIENVVAEYDSVTLIDAYRGTGFNASNRAEYYVDPNKDLTHLGEKGRKVLAEYMAEIMCTQYK